MNIELLGELTHSLLTANGCKGDFRFGGGSQIATRASKHSDPYMVGKACRLQAENPLVPLVQIPRATSNIDIYFFLFKYYKES